MDRVIPAEERNLRTARRLAPAIVLGVVMLGAFAFTAGRLRPKALRRDLTIARVERGSVEVTLPGTGVVVPAFEQVLPAPVDARVLRVLRHAGDRVRAGDPLVELDANGNRLAALRLRDDLLRKESERERAALRQEDAAAASRAELEAKRLDAEILSLKAEQSGRLRAEGLVSDLDDRAATAVAKKAAIDLEERGAAASRAKRGAAAELSALDAELRALRRDLAEAERQETLAAMRADRAGVVTFALAEEGASVSRGQVVARIADDSSFGIAAQIADLHAGSVAAGRRALVSFGGGLPIGGTVESVEPKIEAGTLKFRVRLDSPSDARLRSNGKVEVEVVSGRRDGVLRVLRGALGSGTTEKLFVVRGEELVRTPVELGLAGSDAVEIRDGAREGDELVVSDMRDHDGVDRLRLK